MVTLIFHLTAGDASLVVVACVFDRRTEGHSDAGVRTFDGDGEVFPLDFLGPHRLVVVVGLTELVDLIIKSNLWSMQFRSFT